jgi:hypothetical protein
VLPVLIGAEHNNLISADRTQRQPQCRAARLPDRYW